MRYEVREGSQSGHCCFDATVVDTSSPSKIHKDQYESVCECFSMEDAIRICEALNEVRHYSPDLLNDDYEVHDFRDVPPHECPTVPEGSLIKLAHDGLEWSPSGNIGQPSARAIYAFPKTEREANPCPNCEGYGYAIWQGKYKERCMDCKGTGRQYRVILTIKVGRNTFDITAVDRFMDNGACVQLLTQKTPMKNHYQSCPVLPKREVMRIQQYEHIPQTHEIFFQHIKVFTLGKLKK